MRYAWIVGIAGLALAASAGAAAAQEPTVVILTRHAEKAGDQQSADVPFHGSGG